MNASPANGRIPPSFAILLALSIARFTSGEQISVKEVDGKFPTSSASKLGSGSGVIIAKRYVLTNRHVVQDDSGKLYEGFRVFIGPDFKKVSKEAKVRFVCTDYDLAVIELASDVESQPLAIFDEIPPLATKVVAYGFPLGSQFGVALTATGGQISRQPVEADSSDRSEEADIKRSLWHDALISSGSSGGTLFSEKGVLVGLNYAVLRREGKHTFAIPSRVIAEFLRGCKQSAGVEFTKTLDVAPRKSEAATVYIEILSSGNDRLSNTTSTHFDTSSIHSALLAAVTSGASKVSALQLGALADGDVKQAFQPVRAAAVKDGDIARIAAMMTVIQILDSGMLVELDGVRCMIMLPKGNGGELAARVGSDHVFNVPHDSLYFVSKAQPYTTVTGRTNYFIPLIPIASQISSDELKSIVQAEQTRRKEEEVRRTAELKAFEARRTAEREAKALERYLTLLRHKFTDSSGKYSVDAVLVGLENDTIALIKMPENTKLQIQLSKLSAADAEWIDKNKTWVRLYGARLTDHLLKK